MAERIRTHRDLRVYQQAFEAARQIHEIPRTFPAEERYSLIDQFRRSSRSVCANLAEAWRKRRYAKAFVSNLSDAEAEAGETQVWIEFAVTFGYLERDRANQLYRSYDDILRTLVGMINHPETWLLDGRGKQIEETPESYDPF